MPTNPVQRDRFDDIPADHSRVGAHRAENPRTRVGLLLLWSVVGAIVLFLAGVLAMLIITDRISLFGSDEPGPVVSTSAPAAAVDTSYSVLVLNAAGDPARTDPVKAEVIAAGWAPEAITTTNAEQSDFPTSTVYYATPEDEKAARGLAAALGITSVVESSAYEPTGQDGVKQLTVVIGVDKDSSSPSS